MKQAANRERCNKESVATRPHKDLQHRLQWKYRRGREKKARDAMKKR
jgi:hypothetical protein